MGGIPVTLVDKGGAPFTLDVKNLSITPTGASASQTLADSLGRSLRISGRSPTFAALGDSITASAGGAIAASPLWLVNGYLTWVRALSRGRIQIPVGNNFGVAGDTSAQILARVGNVLAVNPSACIVLAGTNDLALTFEETKASLTAIFDTLTLAGIWVICVPILVRGDSTQAVRQKALRVNEWLDTLRYSRPAFDLADCSLVWIDPTTGNPRTTVTVDNLHPAKAGPYLIAKEIVKLIEARYPSLPSNFSNSNDVFSVDNPTGSLLSNGGMAGTTGTLSNGFTGSLATGWVSNGLNTPAGGAVAFSKVAKADGRQFQQLAFSGTYNSASVTAQSCSLVVGVANVSPGDVLEAVMEVEADAGIQNLAYFGLRVDISGATGVSATDFSGDQNSTLPDEAFSAVLKTPYLVVPAGATGLSLSFRWNIKAVSVSSALAAVVRFGSVSLRKVI